MKIKGETQFSTGTTVLSNFFSIILIIFINTVYFYLKNPTNYTDTANFSDINTALTQQVITKYYILMSIFVFGMHLLEYAGMKRGQIKTSLQKLRKGFIPFYNITGILWSIFLIYTLIIYKLSDSTVFLNNSLVSMFVMVTIFLSIAFGMEITLAAKSMIEGLLILCVLLVVFGVTNYLLAEMNISLTIYTTTFYILKSALNLRNNRDYNVFSY